MKLIKTTFFSAITTFVRVISGFVSSKFISVILGPSGMGQIGGFVNFISIIFTFSNGAINNGIIKYTAQYSNGKSEKLKLLISTAVIITIVCSLSIGIPLIFFSSFFSSFFFKSNLYSIPIRFLGTSLLLFSFNNLLLSIINGKSLIKFLTLINSIGSIFGLLITIILVYFFKIQGALIALVLSQSLIFFVSLFFVVKYKIVSFELFTNGVNVKMAKRLTQFSIMALFATLCVPLSQIIVRNEIINKFGLDSAGYWQGMMRVSEGFLLVVTTAMSTYYLPRFSSLNKSSEIKNEIIYGFKTILPIVLLLSLLVFLFRFKIVALLFSEKFQSMTNLFFPQLFGDFFKICSWILSYLMISKSMTKIYIIIEFVFSITFILLSFFLFNYTDVKGVTVAYAINSFLGFITLIFVFRKTLFSKI